MRKIGKTHLTGVVFALLSSIWVYGQNQLIAEASKYTVGENEQFQVTFRFDAASREFTPPTEMNSSFYITGGPFQSQQTSFINGSRSTEFSWTFALRPRQTGEFIIGPAQIVYDGTTYESKPLRITVVEQSAVPVDPDDPQHIASQLTYMKVNVTDRSVYVGEPLGVQYKLYGRVRPSNNLNFMEQPEWDGFIKEEIDVQPQQKIENVDGRNMYTWMMAAYVLVPQRPGTFSQDPLVTKIPTPVQTNQRDFFGRPRMQEVDNIDRASIPTITVKPLPEEGRTEAFSGSVGQFDLKVSLSKSDVEANQSTSLRIELSGSGNLSTVRLPKPELPDQIEQYEPQRESNYSAGLHGIRGSITEEYILVPRYSGTYKIPPMTFQYFDPSTEEYITVVTDELLIEVEGGQNPVVASGESGAPTPAPSGAPREEVKYLAQDIRHIHAVEASAADHIPFWKKPWYLGGMTLSLAGAAWLLLAGRVQRWNASRSDGFKSAQRRALKQLQRNPSWSEMARHFSQFLLDGYRVSLALQTADGLTQALVRRGLSESAAHRAHALLSECEAADYAAASRPKEKVTEDMMRWIKNPEQS